jgi:hypothetical protein
MSVHRGRLFAALSAAALLLGAFFLPSAAEATQPMMPGAVYRSSGDGLLYEVIDGDGVRQVGNGLGAAAGSTPAVAVTGSGRVIAFRANGTNNLWYVDGNNQGHDTEWQIKAGTSPVIAAQGGSFVVVFVGTDGLLHRYTPEGGLGWVGNGLGTAPGTSPSIAGLPNGQYAIAFKANGSNTLWYVDENNQGHDTGKKIAAGSSSPAIAASTGGYTIVFQNAADNLLWKRTASGSYDYVGNSLGNAAGTSPDIAPQWNGGVMVAFHANGSDHLWYVDGNNLGHDTGEHMAAGANPSVSYVQTSDDWQISYADEFGKLEIVDASGRVYDSKQSLVAADGYAMDLAVRKLTPLFTSAAHCDCTAPTPGLAAVANGLRVRTWSVTSVIEVPAGLPVAGPVDIVLAEPNGPATVKYDKSYGTRFGSDASLADYGGWAFQRKLAFTLTEHGAKTMSFTFTVPVTVVPVTDVSVGPLTFTLTADCDNLNPLDNTAELMVWWAFDNSFTEVKRNLEDYGTTVFPGFARTWSNVLPQDSRRLPWVAFGEDDAPGPGGFRTKPAPGGVDSVASAYTHHVVVKRYSVYPDDDPGCTGEFSYDLTAKVLNYFT